jgi:hypothetical protein
LSSSFFFRTGAFLLGLSSSEFLYELAWSLLLLSLLAFPFFPLALGFSDFSDPLLLYFLLFVFSGELEDPEDSPELLEACFFLLVFWSELEPDEDSSEDDIYLN